MPSHLNRISISSRARQEPIQADLLDEAQEPGIDNTARLGKKRSKNASAQATARSPSRERLPDEIETTPADIPSRSPSQILHQLPHSFPLRRKESSAKHSADLEVLEKVSDEHTPPPESFLASNDYGRTPSTDLLPGLTQAGTPPAHPGYLGRGGFNARSPPISPPQAKARPVSFGGPPPSHYANPRATPTPYQYPASAYGSPPNLPPHLPQQHFYNPQDVDLGLASQSAATQRLNPSLVRFSTTAGPDLTEREVVLLGYGSQLDVLFHTGQGFDHIGRLRNLPGLVTEAVVLTWTIGHDPFHALRPLVAVTLCLKSSVNDQTGRRRQCSFSDQGHLLPYLQSTGGQDDTTSVLVYSLKDQSPIAELLRIPNNVSHEDPSTPSPKMEAHGNFLAVSLVSSGETFVFGVREHEHGIDFDCLTKVWASLQPQLQRRDSSHSRPHTASPSQADSTRGKYPLEQPISSLNGRWLAYRPRSVTATSSGAVIGDRVIPSGGHSLTSRSPPSRPMVTSTIDSPDAPSLFGKVMKGAAQEILRGSKWIGERGMQVLQNYWNPDTVNASSTYAQQYATQPLKSSSAFPPTHAEPSATESNEPEVVAILDLLALQNRDAARTSDPLPHIAVFQPPGGCSYVSFMPNGLGLLTASRKGDVHYVWDLFQMRYPRATVMSRDQETGQLTARVRQIAKYDRVTPSVTVGVAWESPLGSRFVILTQNRTLHMYDLPTSAFRWPPPRRARSQKPSSALAEKLPEAASASIAVSGVFASAMNLASRTQPMLANLRGRTPSASGGVSGVGASGLGLASATGLRGGKVVAAGFSKSLGAASDTVAHLRHTEQSKLHLKAELPSGRLALRQIENKTVLMVLDSTGIRYYHTRRTNPRERQLEIKTVFQNRTPEGNRFPRNLAPIITVGAVASDGGGDGVSGFWKPQSETLRDSGDLVAPLGQAEIETNAPFQPFHSDHRVGMFVYDENQDMAESQLPTASIIFKTRAPTVPARNTEQWVFGGNIVTTKLVLGNAPDEEFSQQQSVVYREVTSVPTGGEQVEHIISTSKRLRQKPQGYEQTDESLGADPPGFFEDDCDLVDFATDRV